MPTTDFENAVSNSENQVVIRLGSAGTVRGVLGDESISFNGGASWEGEETEIGNQINSAFVGLQRAMAQFGLHSRLGGGIGAGQSQKRVQTFVGSTVSWTGTDNFKFTVPLLFVKGNLGSPVMDPIGTLMGSVHPEFEAGGLITIMSAPHGYGQDKGKIVGGCSVRIGKWFRTPPLFVVESVQPSVSRSVTKSGPLWAACSIAFVSARVLSQKEVSSMFVGT